MTLYRGYWPDRSEQGDYKIPSLPKFKQGDIIVFRQDVNVVLDNKNSILTMSGNIVKNCIGFTGGCEFIIDDSLHC